MAILEWALFMGLVVWVYVTHLRLNNTQQELEELQAEVERMQGDA